MSQERTVTNLSTGTSETLSAEQRRSERKAKIASVLSRGIIADRIHVDLPGNLHGEWVPNDPQEITRMQLMGFEIDMEYATKSALHKSSDGKPIMGDVVFMVCDKETKQIIDEVNRERYERMNNPKLQREEAEYKRQAHQPEVPAFIESSTTVANADEIRATLEAANQSLTPAK